MRFLTAYSSTCYLFYSAVLYSFLMCQVCGLTSELVLVQSMVLLIITLVLHIKIRQPDHKGIMIFPWEAVSVLR